MTFIDNWYKERVFYSHSGRDEELTQIVKNICESELEVELYIAENIYVGSPLITKFKDEMLNCNAMIVGWTKNAEEKSSEIISFEIGLAYLLNLPIFIIRMEGTEMPWFFDKITDYAKIKTISIDELKGVIEKFDKKKFLHPIEVHFPKEEYIKYPPANQSENINVIQDDGRIKIGEGFSGILHFDIINNRDKPQTSARVIFKFPDEVTIHVDPGNLEITEQINGRRYIRRNELFYSIHNPQDNSLRIIWETLPLGINKHEVRIIRKSNTGPSLKQIICGAYSNEMTLRKKVIPIEFS